LETQSSIKILLTCRTILNTAIRSY